MPAQYAKDTYYHIYNRGIDKMDIFYFSANYIYLLEKIKKSIHEHGVDMIAYCLMPNHYHFLVRQKTDRPLWTWLQEIFNGYSQAINKQLHRHGALFQGRARHVVVDKYGYLIHLLRYIHYNPVEARIVSGPEYWPYSNYMECIGKRHSILCNMDFIYCNFENTDNFKKFMDEYHLEKQLLVKLYPYFIDA